MTGDKIQKCSQDASVTLHSTVVVGEKGQVVIPKEIRDQVGIKPGDTLISVVKHGIAVGFVKVEDIQKMMDFLNKEMEKFSNLGK